MVQNNQKFRRYHQSIWFPSNTPELILEFFQQLPFKIGVTNHATDELFADKRTLIPLPSKKELLFLNNTLVEFYEIETNNQRTNIVQKVLIRIHNLNENFDFSYIVAREGFIVTAWANDKNDKHRLNKKLNEYWSPTNK